MTFTLEEIAQRLNGRIIGRSDVNISGIASIDTAKKSDISFLFDARYRKLLDNSRAGAFLLSKEFEDVIEPAIIVEDSDAAYLELISVFFEKKTVSAGIHQSAVIGRNCNIAKSVSVGANVTIEDNVTLGENTVIESNTTIGIGVIMGENCHISSAVVVCENVRIGNRVRIHAGTVIGSDGFGFRKIRGTIRKIPHIGNVKIGNDVEIGSNTTIDRGTIDTTVIGDGCKLDNLIQIAHNVRLGKNCMIAAQSGISGSTKLGDSVIMGGKSGIVGHLEIGNQVVIAAKACVTHSFSDKLVLSGFPAREHVVSKRIEAMISKLPSIVTNLQGMRKKIEQLEKEIHASESMHD